MHVKCGHDAESWSHTVGSEQLGLKATMAELVQGGIKWVPGLRVGISEGWSRLQQTLSAQSNKQPLSTTGAPEGKSREGMACILGQPGVRLEQLGGLQGQECAGR